MDVGNSTSETIGAAKAASARSMESGAAAAAGSAAGGAAAHAYAAALKAAASGTTASRGSESAFAQSIKAGRWPAHEPALWDGLAQFHEDQATALDDAGYTSNQTWRVRFDELLIGQAGDGQLDAHDRNVRMWHEHAGFHREAATVATNVADHLRGLRRELELLIDEAEPQFNDAVNRRDPIGAQAVWGRYSSEATEVAENAGANITQTLSGKFGNGNLALDGAVDGDEIDRNGDATQTNPDGADTKPGEGADATQTQPNPDGDAAEGAASPTTPDATQTNPEPEPVSASSTPDATQTTPVPGQPMTPMPMPSMPASPLGSGAGSGGGGLSSGLGGSSSGLSSALKPASSIPSASAGTSPASALPQVPSTTPDSFASGLSNAGSSFQSGVASGMGASGAVSPVSQPLQPLPTQQPAVAAPVTGIGAQGVSSAAVPDGPVGGGPTGHGPAAGAPGGAPVGGGGVMPPPMAGGQPLAPYSSPGAGAGGGVPATPTGPASGGPAQSSSAAAPAGAPAMVAGSSGTSTAASAVAASTTDVNPDLSTAQRVLADLVRGTDRSGDLQVVWWAVSVVQTPPGPLTVIASSVGGGGYVPASVYLPVASRLAVFDSSLPMGWAEDWMGWQSPVAILAAHYELVAETAAGVRVSAIATSEVWPRRPDCGGDFVAIQQKDILQMPGEAPIMDGAHQHRLTVIDPGLARRVAALDRGGDVTAWVGAQLTAAVIRAAMEPDETGQKLATPQDAEILEAVNSGRATADRWAAYDQEVDQRDGGAVMLPEIHAPRDRDSSPASVDARMWYRHYYRMGRIVELVRCWRSQPVSLADVAYCGLAAGYGSAVVGMIAAMEQHLSSSK